MAKGALRSRIAATEAICTRGMEVTAKNAGANGASEYDLWRRWPIVSTLRGKHVARCHVRRCRVRYAFFRHVDRRGAIPRRLVGAVAAPTRPQDLDFPPPGLARTCNMARHPREGGDPLALMPRFFLHASRAMDSCLRRNDDGFTMLPAFCFLCRASAPAEGRIVEAENVPQPCICARFD